MNQRRQNSLNGSTSLTDRSSTSLTDRSSTSLTDRSSTSLTDRFCVDKLTNHNPSLGLITTSFLLTVSLAYSLDAQAQLTQFSPINHPKAMTQINSVSALRDVEPTDWAYTALQSLVERYGCIVGYPDRTYRGNRALTRYEFAAGLNACLDKLSDLIASGKNVLQEDIDTLKRLQQEFANELNALSVRVENLEARTSFLEDHQFTTNTRLIGTAVVSAQAYFSGEGTTQAVLQQQNFMRLNTSFSGRDLLTVGLAQSNARIPFLSPLNDGRFVGATPEGTTIWAYGGSSENQVFIPSLEYIFPIIDNGRDRWYLTLAAVDGFNTSRFLLPIGPLTWEGYDLGTGPISAFGQRNPLYRLGGGTGLITNYDTGPWRWTVAYLATDASDPSQGKGLFNGDYLALTQLNYTPNSRLALAFTYFHNYFGPGRFSFNNQIKFLGPESPGFVGTGLANRFDNAGVFFDENVSVSSNTYGFQGFYQPFDSLVIGGFVSQINARLLGRGDATIWSYALSLAFPDIGKEGSLGGVIVGVEPTLTDIDAQGVSLSSFKRDTSLHIEGFYRYPINNNISITPGFIWITAPNQDADNDDIFLGVLRTTFLF